MKKQLVLLISLLLLVTNLYSYVNNKNFYKLGSSTDVGNGGDVVVCYMGDDLVETVTSIDLLDYYESEMAPRNFEYDLGGDELTVQEKIDYVLDRFKKLSPARAENYRAEAREFYDNAVFLTGKELTDISDSRHIATPYGCKIKQIAVQIDPMFPEDKRYTINKDLWDLLDNNNKAGLILHEIIYKEAIESGHQNSIVTRYFNALISSNRIKSYSTIKFVGLLRTIDFKYVSIDGLKFFVNDELKFYRNGNLEQGRIAGKEEFIYRREVFEITDIIKFHGNKQVKYIEIAGNEAVPVRVQYKRIFNEILAKFCISFYPDGKIESVCNISEIPTLTFDNLELSLQIGELFSWNNGMLQFSDNGLIEEAKVKHKDATITVEKYEQLRLWSNGSLQSGNIKEAFNITLGTGDLLNIKAGSYIRLFENGDLSFMKGRYDAQYEFSFNFGKFTLRNQNLYFHETGVIKEFSFYKNNRVVKIQGKYINCLHKAETYRSGNLKSTNIFKNTKLLTESGEERWFVGGSKIFFNEDGLVIANP